MSAIANRIARSDGILALVTVALTSVATVTSLRLWAADLRVPFTYSGDALPTGAHFKTVIEEGWYEFQPLLGAPLGQTYNDFPTADNLHMLVARLLSVFTSDWAVALNVYFLIGFPLAALTALLFLRTAGVSRPLSVTLATLYAIAPYHFLRGESHLWLASYYAVPLGAVLLLLVLRGLPLWGWGRRGGRVRRVVLSPTTRTLVFVALLATSSSYYAVFFLAILGCAGLITLIRDRSWHRFWGAAAAGLATVAVMLVNMAPDLLFSWTHGPNPSGLERSPGEAEYYALKFAQLVLPWPGHRIETLAHLRQLYDSGYVSLGEQPALGIVAASGFVAAFVLVALAAARGLSRRRLALSPRIALATGLSALVLVAFMFATLGGVSTLISVFTSSLRGWNRMSIVIAILSLAIIGLLVDAATRRVRLRRGGSAVARRVIAGGIAIAFLAVGYLDQTPGDADAHYAANAARFRSDAAFVDRIEEALPESPRVLALPYIPFPESASESGLLASEQLIPYLHSDAISWSNGGIKGRPEADWPTIVDAYGAAEIAPLAATAGFDGIFVFRAGYRDGGQEVEAAIAAATGTDPFVDEQARYVFFDLSQYSARVERATPTGERDDAREHILSPVVAYAAPDFGRATLDDGSIELVHGDGSAGFTLANDSGHERRVAVEVLVHGVAGSTATFEVEGAVVGTARLDGASALATFDLEVPSGTTVVRVTMTGPGGAPADAVRISEPEVTDPSLAAYLERLGGALK